MIVKYKKKKLKKLMESRKMLIKKYGQQSAYKINQRVRELEAAECLEDLPPTARIHPYEPKEKGRFSIDILKHKHPIRMIIAAQGDFDLAHKKTIKRIQIEEIKKTHS